ncbi:polymorphic toxin-type HINT domain-containing protein [Actinomycetospora sp. CA-084318]|uniref:polymorphic toxin-type HINT domain-containing protein n=1 Tax=Actinomycetospora sp. CA-084318 TaxID=3239892 RepID=UPI003D970917
MNSPEDPFWTPEPFLGQAEPSPPPPISRSPGPFLTPEPPRPVGSSSFGAPPTGSWPGQAPFAAQPAIPPRTVRRRLWLIFGGAGIVLLLLVGVVTWLAASGRGDRGPFDEAVEALALAPGIHDQDALPDGSLRWDLRLSEHGEAIGTVTANGTPFDVMAVGGKTYLRIPNGVTNVDGVAVSPDKAGRWVAGLDDALGPVRERLTAPAALADGIRTSLDSTRDFPTTADAPSAVDGVATLTAHTPSGDLSISQSAPHRVLRFSPTPTSSPLGHELVLQGTSSPGSAQLSEMPEPEVASTYDRLTEAVPDLASAVVDGIDFRLQGQPQIDCNSGGCSVTATETDSVSSTDRAVVTGGTVTRSMSATVTIDGRPAGGCTQTGALPLSGTGALSCEDPGAGPTFAAADAVAREKALATAAPGTTVQYTVPVYVAVDMVAVANVDVAVLVDQLANERADATCASPPNSFVAGTPVLLADGTTRSIESLTPGDQVLATDTATGTTRPEPVLDVIVGHHPAQLTTLTISSAGRDGSVTATDNHPFWDPERGEWVEAGALRRGEHLATRTGVDAMVTASRPWSADASVYNLSVRDLHTYDVEAGSTYVLVHNASPKPCMYPWPVRPTSVSLSAARRTHILDGDGPNLGGGHRAGTGKPGKTEFPASWSDDDIVTAATAVALEEVPIKEVFQVNGRWAISARYNGIVITSLVNQDGSIWTAYPRYGPGVVFNPRK